MEGQESWADVFFMGLGEKIISDLKEKLLAKIQEEGITTDHLALMNDAVLGEWGFDSPTVRMKILAWIQAKTGNCLSFCFCALNNFFQYNNYTYSRPYRYIPFILFLRH